MYILEPHNCLRNYENNRDGKYLACCDSLSQLNYFILSSSYTLKSQMLETIQAAYFYTEYFGYRNYNYAILCSRCWHSTRVSFRSMAGKSPINLHIYKTSKTQTFVFYESNLHCTDLWETNALNYTGARGLSCFLFSSVPLNTGNWSQNAADKLLRTDLA